MYISLKGNAESLKPISVPRLPIAWLWRAREMLQSGRRNTGAGAPFGGLFAFWANPLARPLAKKFFPTLQAVTLLVLILSGRLGLPVIGRGHRISLM